MAPLTKKQTAQLSEMSHDVLVNIIYDLIQDNKGQDHTGEWVSAIGSRGT
jgi:hypothetical protein